MINKLCVSYKNVSTQLLLVENISVMCVTFVRNAFYTILTLSIHRDFVPKQFAHSVIADD